MQPQSQAPTQAPAATPERTVVEHRESNVTQLMFGMFAALGFALSARLILLLTIIGAFALGVLAVEAANVTSLVVLGLYGVCAVIPMVILEYGKRPTKE